MPHIRGTYTTARSARAIRPSSPFDGAAPEASRNPHGGTVTMSGTPPVPRDSEGRVARAPRRHPRRRRTHLPHRTQYGHCALSNLPAVTERRCAGSRPRCLVTCPAEEARLRRRRGRAHGSPAGTSCGGCCSLPTVPWARGVRGPGGTCRAGQCPMDVRLRPPSLPSAPLEAFGPTWPPDKGSPS